MEKGCNYCYDDFTEMLGADFQTPWNSPYLNLFEKGELRFFFEKSNLNSIMTIIQKNWNKLLQ